MITACPVAHLRGHQTVSWSSVRERKDLHVWRISLAIFWHLVLLQPKFLTKKEREQLALERLKQRRETGSSGYVSASSAFHSYTSHPLYLSPRLQACLFHKDTGPMISTQKSLPWIPAETGLPLIEMTIVNFGHTIDSLHVVCLTQSMNLNYEMHCWIPETVSINTVTNSRQHPMFLLWCTEACMCMWPEVEYNIARLRWCAI